MKTLEWLMMFLTRLFFFAAVSIYLIPLGAVANELTFASIQGLVEQKVGAIVLPKVYARLGYKVEIKPLPGKRAQKSANMGTVDGEIMRIFAYGEETPNTIRVPTPYYELETTAFARRGSGVEIKNKSDLTGAPSACSPLHCTPFVSPFNSLHDTVFPLPCPSHTHCTSLYKLNKFHRARCNGLACSPR